MSAISGASVKARNTLDLNYIPLAERHHADVRAAAPRPEHRPRRRGYTVHYDRIAGGGLTAGSVTGRIVILAAGSLGSTELLLQCRDVHRSLPNISAFLGRNWSSNGDFLTPALHPMREVKPTRGPTITSAIDLLDGTVDGQDALHRGWRIAGSRHRVHPRALRGREPSIPARGPSSRACACCCG